MFHMDKLGSVVAMSNATNGQLPANAGPFAYDAFGNCTTGGGACSATATPYLYTGQRFDPETGLYYYRARCYLPTLGRFCQTDPVGYGDGQNWYLYTHDDPTDNTDPKGLYTLSCDSSNPHTIQTCQTAAGEFETQRQANLNSDDPDVRAAAEALGDPGKYNHVVVAFRSQHDVDRAAGQATWGKHRRCHNGQGSRR